MSSNCHAVSCYREMAPPLLLSMASPAAAPPGHQSSPTDGSRFPHDFLSCEDISAQSQKVTCSFLRNVTGIGFLDPSAELSDVAAGTKLELPLWLAKVLLARKLVDVEIPKGYNETYREILEADAAVVDLHKLGPDFYTFGQHLLSLDVKDGADIARSLVSAFHQRFHLILDYAMNSSLDTQAEVLKFQGQLDNSELLLLNSGRKAADSFKQWENRTCDRMKATDMVSTLNKKKKAVVSQEQQQTRRPE